ncbi:hypothetical protein NBT05_14355 [Aquimarina sp. ERC-38]|uniref:hypothetical protein n=1 Tax=Aquimarina sp. ERC-38 TaxID=2949996 RepID=UPI002245B8FD|nr:hypothetical protein [Aquimarina sp. ERC-38]UZO80124.1 hypothetical protein NBT05_14355 [Aquimarina sp. ERC-38]
MKKFVLICLILFPVIACSGDDKKDNEENMTTDPEVVDITEEAQVTNVTVQGEPGAYTFAVEIKSPDTGCDQYADWWEVVTAEGTLIYRRILAHSHVAEQPFTRSGGKIVINPEDSVLVRVHMNNTGYARNVFSGSVAKGFKATEVQLEADTTLAKTAPLPNGCGG